MARLFPAVAVAGIISVTSALAQFAEVKLENPLSGHRTRSLGYSSALDGDTLIAGAPDTHLPGALGAGLACIFRNDGQGNWTPEAQLVAPDPAANDQFGFCVAISGDTAVAGAILDDYDETTDCGSVYVFTRSGSTWTAQAKLFPADAVANHRFGTAVSISGDTIVVGARGDDAQGADAGAAYVFTRSDGAWTQQAKLTAADAAVNDWFAISVAIRGDTIVAGAVGDKDQGSFTGSAYVFIRSGETWTQQAKLTASDAGAHHWFGSSVAIDYNTVVVGADGDDHAGARSGSAYVFVRSGGVWTEQAKLTAADADAGDEFGHSVAASGDTAVVGAWRQKSGVMDSGAAYVFARSGAVWSQQVKLKDSHVDSFDKFGVSVAISGDTMAAGVSDGEAGPGAGAVCVFNRTDDAWTLQAKVNAIDNATQNLFGLRVLISGDLAMVGAPYTNARGLGSGAVWVYARAGGDWALQQEVVPSDASAGDFFGSSLMVSGDTAIVGAYADDAPVSDCGSAYVFTNSGGAWTEQAKLTASDAAPYDLFGESVAISGDIAVVGAPLDDGGDEVDCGSAYVFARPQGAWWEVAKLVAPDATRDDYFGAAVDVDGDTIVVGSSRSTTGTVYVFMPEGAAWSMRQKLMASDAGPGNRFGRSVALEGDTLVVGAPPEYVGAEIGTGAAYVFSRTGDTWTEQAKLIAADAAPDNGFGSSVAIAGGTIVIGASRDDSEAAPDPEYGLDFLTAAGSVYVFSQRGGAWTQCAKLTPSDPGTLDLFGSAVSISGDTVIVGAAWNDDPEEDSGAAYLFTVLPSAPSKGLMLH